MGYYKYYLRKLIKFILRLFDKKTLILIILFLLFLCYNEGVFALEKSVYDLTDEEILQLTDEDIDSMTEDEVFFILDRLDKISTDYQTSLLDFTTNDSVNLSNIANNTYTIYYLLNSSSSGWISHYYNVSLINDRCELIFDTLNHYSSYLVSINDGISEITKYFKQSTKNPVDKTDQISFSSVSNIGPDINAKGKFVSASGWITIYFPIDSVNTTTYDFSFINNGISFIRVGWLSTVPAVGVVPGSCHELSISSPIHFSLGSQPSGTKYIYVSIYSSSSVSGMTLVKNYKGFEDVDNPLNIFDNQQKNHEEEIANSNQNTDKINNTLTSSEVSEDTYNIDTSFTGELNDDSYNNFLINWINTIISAVSSRSSTTLDIPIPFVDETISISSDVVSSRIQGTIFYSLIQIFWYFLFGAYFFRFGSRAVHWLTSGELVEKGPSAFADYLMKQNAIITSDLM